MADMDDLFRRLLAERTQSSSQAITNPISGQTQILQSPDRLWANIAQMDPSNIDPTTTQGYTTWRSDDKPIGQDFNDTGLQYSGMKPTDKTLSVVNKFATPDVQTHEGVHQVLTNLANKLGIKSLAPLREEGSDPNEYPAYLFAEPRELFTSDTLARSKQLQYLQQLKQVDPVRAKVLEGLMLR